MTTHATAIPGYTYGTSDAPRSPVTLDELEKMKQTVMFGDDDVRALRRSYDVLKDQVEAILDVWYGFVGATPHLLASFSTPDGRPHAEYLAAVRRRFGQWILDTARAELDQAWLDYQHEIALRHHRTKKNRTDGVDAAAIVPFRDLPLLIAPVTITLRPFLAARGDSDEEVTRMQMAWLKACLLQVALWSRPYVRDGDY